MRVVLDANVAIAAVATHGLCQAIFELCLEHHQIVTCNAILDEIQTKLIHKLKVPAPIVADFLSLLQQNALLLDPEPIAPFACRDPNDLMILGLVRPGKINAIITGDKDLLVLNQFHQAHILSPRQFWQLNKTP
ncbi:MAG: putative toxin-antitoxin system toxin component, PIN family [Lentisphaerae bacterium]|nr:putative toxin-antitoxin system toxin component, PIN family [Lentisphaerota bacterium]